MEKGIEGERIKPSDDKPTLEVEKEGDAEKSEPSKDNLRVGTKRSFDVAFLTGSDTTRGGPIQIPEESRFRFLGYFWHILEELEPELDSKES